LDDDARGVLSNLLHVLCWEGDLYLCTYTFSIFAEVFFRIRVHERALWKKFGYGEGLGFGFYLPGAWVFDTTRVTILLVLDWSDGVILSHSLYGMFKCTFVFITLVHGVLYIVCWLC
jgi:hypothetical protein